MSEEIPETEVSNSNDTHEINANDFHNTKDDLNSNQTISINHDKIENNQVENKIKETENENTTSNKSIAIPIENSDKTYQTEFYIHNRKYGYSENGEEEDELEIYNWESLYGYVIDFLNKLIKIVSYPDFTELSDFILQMETIQNMFLDFFELPDLLKEKKKLSKKVKKLQKYIDEITEVERKKFQDELDEINNEYDKLKTQRNQLLEETDCLRKENSELYSIPTINKMVIPTRRSPFLREVKKIRDFESQLKRTENMLDYHKREMNRDIMVFSSLIASKESENTKLEYNIEKLEERIAVMTFPYTLHTLFSFTSHESQVQSARITKPNKISPRKTGLKQNRLNLTGQLSPHEPTSSPISSPRTHSARRLQRNTQKEEMKIENTENEMIENENDNTESIEGFPQANTEIEGFPQANTEIEGFPQANTEIEGFPQANTEIEGFPQANTEIEGFPQANTEIEGFPQANTEIEGFPQANTEIEGFPQANTEIEGFPQANTEIEGFPQANTEIEGFPQANTEIEGFPQANTEIEGFPQANTEIEGFPQANTETEGFPKANTEIEGFPQANTEIEGFPKANTEIEGFPKTDTNSSSEGFPALNESDSLSKTLPSNLAQFIPDPAHQRKTQISFAPGVVIPPQTHEFRYNPTEKADHQKCPITPEDRKIYDDLAVKLADESILAAIDEVKKKEGGEDSLLVPNE